MTGLRSLSAIELPSGPVSVLVDGPSDASVVVALAHGAGADMGSEFMSLVATGIAAQGFLVVRFNFPYAQAGRRSPDKQPVLENAWRTVLARIEAASEGRPIVAGGKSLGGRIASHVAASGAPIQGLVFLGYPLHPPGKPERMRAEHLASIGVPMLFVEGTRDPFCPLPTLERVIASLDANVDVKVVDDGDHSFRVRASSGRSTQAAWEAIPPAVAAWLRRFAR
jgi:predicted alpha/beta-hydrolase family hydrolase